MSRISGNARSGRSPRASWKVRGTIIVLSVIMVVGAVVAAVNWRSLSANNAAVNSLNASIAAYAKDSPDLHALKTAQQQTDAQFREAQGLGSLQLPQVRSVIDANAAESARLSAQIDKDLQQNNDTQSGSVGAGKTGQSTGQGDSASKSSDAEKIDKLLEQNKKIDMKNVPDTSHTTEGDENTNSKPW